MMSLRGAAIGIRKGVISRRLADYLSLTKPRLVPMVLIATSGTRRERATPRITPTG